MGGPLKLNKLQNPIARQNWNKHNLYNLYRLMPRSTMGRTFFQQKFAAKSETRKYHGEHLTERKWNDLFSTTIRGVLPLDPARLGASDGREVAEGRGAGQDGTEGVGTGYPRGKRSREAIPWMMGLYAPVERRLDTAIFRAMFASSVRQARSFIVHGRVKVNGKKFRHPSYLLNPGDMFSIDPELVLFAVGAPKDFSAEAIARRKALKEKAGLGTTSEESDGSEAVEASSETPESTELESSESTTVEASTIPGAEGTDSESESDAEKEDPKDAMKEIEHPYAYPWRPRDYLSAFAFIPRYLEVNHTICHAVYLRHPVVRPGESEVPSPFPEGTMQLAYNWYLRRR